MSYLIPMPRRAVRRALALLAVGAGVVGLGGVSSSGAARNQATRCVGNAYFCAATLPIGGGVHNRLVTISLTDTNFDVAGVWTIPAASAGKFRITHAGFRLGGSEYRLTLNARRSNPSRARVLILFTSGR